MENEKQFKMHKKLLGNSMISPMLICGKIEKKSCIFLGITI